MLEERIKVIGPDSSHSIIDPRGKLDKSQGRSQVRQIYLNTTHNETEIE